MCESVTNNDSFTWWCERLYITLNEVFGGHVAPSQKKKYKDFSARIVTIVADFPQRNILDFLKAISLNINM